MRVLVTGHDGYIGHVVTEVLRAGGHEVHGWDTFYYAGGSFGDGNEPSEGRRSDIRDIGPADLDGIDAVVHLAALSNDPVGDLNSQCTYAINHGASVELASLARDAGATRFLFASSCSLYGAGNGGLLEEDAPFNPVTAYGESKVMVEQDVAKLATDDFSPTFLRNATAYGVSPRLRGDIVVNNLVGLAFTTGEVRLQSDGTPWRPLVHVRDIAAAFLAILEAPREVVHNEAFNVGRSDENYRIREVAEIVEAAVPDSKVTMADHAGPDIRNYRVSFDKLASLVPGFAPEWTVPKGIIELRDAFRRHGLCVEDLLGPRFQRVARLKQLRALGALDEQLRWRAAATETVA
jgi:nucleoside-diphosphate-sugar epimerase